MTASAERAHRSPVAPTVSVVIPSTGRPTLADAIRTVRRQDYASPVEIVVVLDGVQPSRTARPAALDDVDRVVVLDERRGGGAARNAGVRAADGDLVAFLDDDDEWMPHKLSTQSAAVLADPDPDRLVVSSRFVYMREASGDDSGPKPRHLIAADADVATYLFRRRVPHSGRASLYTSSLLCSRQLAEKVPWHDDLPRHQDWDWLIRLQRDGDARIVQAAEPLVRIRTGSPGSISAGTDWPASLAWADAALRSDANVYVDFLAAQTLRYALAANSARGVRACITEISRTRTVPSAGPMVTAAAGLVPRSAIEAALRGRTWPRLRTAPVTGRSRDPSDAG